MNTSLSRRNFFKASSLLSAAAATGGIRSSSGAENSSAAAAGTAKKIPIGLELYSVRGEMGKDLPKTLKLVASYGYEVVEFYSAYYKWTPIYAKEVRMQLDDLGMRCLSTHNGFESFSSPENLGRAIELNQILGCRYLVLAGAPRTEGVEGWKSLCGKLTKVVEDLQPHGLKTGFHNHQTEWKKIDGGQSVMEILAANTPKDFALQLDVGTCLEAGSDPVAWVKANPGRIKMMHLKDWAPETAAKDKGYKVLFSEGVTPWKELLAAAEAEGGIEFYLIEQEGSRFPEFETAKRCLENWKALRKTSA